MASQGPLTGSVGANDASFGTGAWSNPTNAQVEDGIFASIVSPAGGGSNYLKVQGFGFSIPAGATINGILLEIKQKFTTTANGAVQSKVVKMVKSDGTFSTTDKGSITQWSATLGFVGYGSSSELWGESWGASDINSANFGAVVSTTSATCFVGETMVDTPKGKRRIKDIRVGDEVLGFDHDTKEIRTTKVLRLQKPSYSTKLLEITVGSLKVRCTPNHLVITPQGSVRASSLSVGDEIYVRSRGRVVARTVTARHIFAKRERVYDIGLEKYGAYFADGFVVHNFGSTAPTANVDCMQITVTYTAAGGAVQQQSRNVSHR